MSDVDHTNALAAEYVLGTLDSEEREQARALLGADKAFADKVVQWERRLGELHLMVEPVEPDTQIWTRIKSKMPETQSRSNARLPEAHIPEPAPVAIPAAAPSLDAIQAAISETAAVLTSEAAAAPTSEAASPAWETGSPASEAGSPASEITEAPVSEVIEALGRSRAACRHPSRVRQCRSGAGGSNADAGRGSAPDVDAAPRQPRWRARAMTDATRRRPRMPPPCRPGTRLQLRRPSSSRSRPAGGAASIGHGGRSDARGARAGRRGNATGRAARRGCDAGAHLRS
jgi:hypothetical protein